MDLSAAEVFAPEEPDFIDAELDETPWDYPPELERSADRPKRTASIPDLPPLPVGLVPQDGESRFDWRRRSLSQMKKKVRRKRWFPDQHFDRIQPEKGKLTWGDTFHDELERYKAHFIPLLEAELQEETRLFQMRLKEWPLQRLQREGFSLSNLQVYRQAIQPRQGGIIYELRRDPKKDVPLPFHKFTTGTAIILSKTDPLVDAILADGQPGPLNEKSQTLAAQIYSISRHYIRIHTDTPIDDHILSTMRLDVGHGEWATRTQINAILAMNNDPVEQDMFDKVQAAEARKDMEGMTRKAPLLEQTVLSGTALRDKVLRAFQQDFVPYESTTSLSVNNPASGKSGKKAIKKSLDEKIEIVDDGIVPPQNSLKAEDVDATPVLSRPAEMEGSLIRNQMIRSWAMRHRAEGEIVRSDSDPHVPLNPSQLRAIALMLSERLSLVQGPPGTGKTRVIIETIKLLKKHWQIPHPILVTAHTNVAVDNLVGGLRNHGLKAVRLGLPERIRPDLQNWSFDFVSQSHPLCHETDMLQTEVNDLWKRDDRGRMAWTHRDRQHETKRIRNRLHGLRAAMFTDVLLDADVICTTCLSAASSYILKYIDCPIVFLDEASMATEPLSLVPLMKGSSHVAIIGDHKQLPPIIISDAAKTGGLATSLFERLIHERHVPSIMLDTQYRMHPSIAAFPSKTFYNSDLKDGTQREDGTVVPGFDTPVTGYLEDVNGRPTNMTFIDHDHPESPEMRSIANHGDAEIIGDIVVDLLLNNPELQGSDIGIIAPYAAQIRAIDRKLNTDPIVLDAMADVLGPNRASHVQDIEIKTVDGFEGREKQVIIFSTVRSNDAGYIGFLGDWRRLNVGITRAKRGLIMVGSAKTLEKARMGAPSAEHLPEGGSRVWQDFMSHLRENGLVIQRAN